MSISILNRGASGGLKPELTVTAPSGSTIDLLQNGIIVATYTLGASETEHTFVVKVGTYTVRGTLGEDTAESEVVIDTIGQYGIEVAYIYPVFANNTWEKIIELCKANKVPNEWVVGNQKNMTIDGTDYVIDIIGKNHDTYSDGSGTAPLTFQFHDCYGTTAQIKSYNGSTNSGGWTSCSMRSSFLPSVLALMPSEVQAGVKEVNKLTTAGNKSTGIDTTSDKLFLLSEVEVLGGRTNSGDGEGSRYAYYAQGGSRIKGGFTDTNGNYWWFRSPCITSKNTWCCLSNPTNGGVVMYPSSSLGVSPAFCF